MPRAKSAADDVAAGYRPQTCLGKSRAWGAKFSGEEHIAFKPHLPCWHCGAELGCVRCSGPTYELLCMDCKDWGHKDAYDRHGRLLKGAEERAEGVKMLKSIMASASEHSANTFVANSEAPSERELMHGVGR